MAQEQTAYVGDDIKVLVNVIGSTGAHVVAVIDTTTTRLNGLAAAPTITTIATGVYQIVFSGVTPTPAESDRYTCKVNGTIAGVAWTEYGIPIKIVADERGTDSVVVPTSDITAIKSKTDQLAFTVANEVDSNSLTGGTSPAAIYTEFTSGSNANAFKATGFNTVAPDNASVALILADTNELQTNQGNWLTATGFNTIAPDNSSITAIKAKTDNFVFTVSNQVDANALAVPAHGSDATLANQTTILGMLTGASVVVSQSSLKVGDTVTLRQGMDYDTLDGTEISWSGSLSDQWPDLTGSTITFYAVQGESMIFKQLTITSPTGTQSFKLEMTASELSSTNAPSGNYRYYILAVLVSGRTTSLIEDSTLRIEQPYGV